MHGDAPARRRRWALDVLRTLGMCALALLVGQSTAAGHPLVPGLMFGLVLVASVTTGPFGLMLGFIAVLFTRPGDFFPALEGIGIARIFASSALLMLLGIKLVERDRSVARSPYNVWMAALTGAVILSVVDSTAPFDSVVFFNNVFVKIVLLWFLMFETMNTRRRTVSFQVVVALMTTLIAGYSIWARFTGTNLIEGTRSSFVGLLADPNDLAMTLLMAVPFLIEATLSRRVGRARLFWGLLLVVNIAGIIVTQSRGGFLGLGAATFVIMRSRIRSTALVGAAIVVALAGMVVLSGITERQTVVRHEGGMDASAQGRIDAWIAGGRMLLYNPITGVGLFQVTANYSDYAVNPIDWRPKTSHNAFVQAAAETGFTGIIPFVGLVVLGFLSSWRLRKERPPDASPTEDAFLRSLFPTMAGVMVAACFLSVAWSWFFYIVIAQAGTAHRVWITFPEVLQRQAEQRAGAAERGRRSRGVA